MSFQQSDESYLSQPDSFRSDNAEDTAGYSMPSSPPCTSGSQDLVSHGIFGSSNSGSASGEWMLQQSVDWVAARSSHPSGIPYPDNHELCRHEELFCVHFSDTLGAEKYDYYSAGSFPSYEQEQNDRNGHAHMDHQPTTTNHMPAVAPPQVPQTLQPNMIQHSQHRSYRLAAPNISNGNRKTQLPPHKQPSAGDRQHYQSNGSQYSQGHGYTQPTQVQPQQHSKAGTTAQFDLRMYNMQVHPSNPPSGAHNDQSGRFFQFQLLDSATAAAQVDMSRHRPIPAFSTGKIQVNQPRVQVPPPQPAQHMLSSQHIQQLAPTQPIQQHRAPVQPDQYVAPSQYDEYMASSQPDHHTGTIQPDQNHATSWHPVQYVAPSQTGQYTAPSQPAQPMVPSQCEQYTETSQLSRQNPRTIVAPTKVSVKRKARTDAERDLPKAKKTKTAVSQAGDAPTGSLRPKKTARKQKYDAIAGILDDELPDYTQVSLSFLSRDAAAAAAAQKLAKPLERYFRSANEDDTVPETDDDRQNIVRNLFGAMKDVSRAKDIDSPVVQSRWAADASKRYDDIDIEATCWEIVTLTERLHREGPSALSIRDPNYVTHIKNCADLNFVQRIRVITTIAFQWKARCDGLIKGDTIQTLVAAPLEALQSALNNWKANKERTTLYKFAKDHQDGPKKPAPKCKKGKKTEPKPPNQQVDDTDPPHPASSDYVGDVGSSQSNEAFQQMDETGSSRRAGLNAPVEVSPVQMNETLQPGDGGGLPNGAHPSSPFDCGPSPTNEPPRQYQRLQQDREAGLSSQINSSSLDQFGYFETSEPPERVNEAVPSSQTLFGDFRRHRNRESFDSFNPYEPFEPFGSPTIIGTPHGGYSKRTLEEHLL